MSEVNFKVGVEVGDLSPENIRSGANILGVNGTMQQINVVQTTGTSETDVMSQKVVTEQLATKQDTLTAGDGITIENNTISASASGGGLTRKLASARFFTNKFLQTKNTSGTQVSTSLQWQTPQDKYNGSDNIFSYEYAGTRRYIRLRSDIIEIIDNETSKSYYCYGVKETTDLKFCERGDYASNTRYLCCAVQFILETKVKERFIIDISFSKYYATSYKTIDLDYVSVKKQVYDITTGIVTETILPDVRIGTIEMEIIAEWYE